MRITEKSEALEFARHMMEIRFYYHIPRDEWAKRQLDFCLEYKECNPYVYSEFNDTLIEYYQEQIRLEDYESSQSCRLRSIGR